MEIKNPKKLHETRDATATVLHGVQDADSLDAYPILVDQHGGMRSSQNPSNQQMRIEYNSNGTQKYIGYNDRGKSESSDDWLLHFLEYDGTNRIIKRTIAYDSWDNRASATYT